MQQLQTREKYATIYWPEHETPSPAFCIGTAAGLQVSVTPAWIFLFRIKRTSLTYFCGERPISYCTVHSEYLNSSTSLGISTAFQTNHYECNLNQISCVPCEYGVSTYSLLIFRKKFYFASFSVEPWGLEQTHFNKPYSDVITKTITKSHHECTARNTLEYSRNTNNVPRRKRCHQRLTTWMPLYL